MNVVKLLVVTIAILLAGCSKHEAEISDQQQSEYNNYFNEDSAAENDFNEDESAENYLNEDESTENYVWDYLEDESEKWNPNYKPDDTKIIGL